MKLIACCVALGAMLAISAPAQAQDVTLTARDGGLELAGTLMGFDGEFYRIDTVYGPLTVDAQGVICDGPGCPDLTAPREGSESGRVGARERWFRQRCLASPKWSVRNWCPNLRWCSVMP